MSTPTVIQKTLPIVHTALKWAKHEILWDITKRCLAVSFLWVLSKLLPETSGEVFGLMPALDDSAARIVKVVKVVAVASLLGVVIYAGLKLSAGRRTVNVC